LKQLSTPYWRVDNWIANEVGINHSTVRRVREELEARGEIPKVDKTVGKDGKARPTELAKLASSKPEPDPWEGKVICGDAFEVLRDEPQIYDLISDDPPYNISGTIRGNSG
jgi:hypothetical protein